MFGKQLGEHMGTLGLCHHIPPGAIKGRCASMAPLIRPITPTLTICAALLGVGLTIATNAEQAFPCTYRVPHDGRSQRIDASWIRLPVAPKDAP